MTEPAGGWTFLTNHARVLRVIALDTSARIRDIAAACRISERATQNIVADLEQAGYLTRQRIGRRTHYSLHLDGNLRHPADAQLPVHTLLDVFADHDERESAKAPAPGIEGSNPGTRSSNAGPETGNARK